jgi:hypothetical protein
MSNAAVRLISSSGVRVNSLALTSPCGDQDRRGHQGQREALGRCALSHVPLADARGDHPVDRENKREAFRQARNEGHPSRREGAGGQQLGVGRPIEDMPDEFRGWYI